jgi:hypothetical protein
VSTPREELAKYVDQTQISSYFIDEMGIISVASYGAIGDGTTDDTVAIQNAIDAAEANGGGVVFFPKGVYAVSNLTVTESIVLQGSGESTIKQKVSTSGDMISFSGTSKTTIIENLIFDGNNTGQAAQSTNMLLRFTVLGTAGSPYVAWIHNCSFINQCYVSVYFCPSTAGSLYEHIYISNNKFVGGNEAVNTAYHPRYVSIIDGGRALIEDNLFDLGKAFTTGVAGITLAVNSPATEKYADISVLNNRFNNIGTNLLGAVDFYVWGDKVKISGNKCYNSQITPIRGKSNSRDVIITENFVDTVNAGGGIAVTPATTATSNENFTISNNIVRNITGPGISVSGRTDDGLNYVLVSGNHIYTTTTNGIEVHYLNNVIITSNIISQPYLSAIYATYCTGQLEITNNMIDNLTTGYGVYIETGVSTAQLTVSNNCIRKASKYGMYLSALDAAIISNNLVDDITERDAVEVGIFASVITNLILTGNVVKNTATPKVIGTITNLVEKGNSFNGQVFYGTATPISGTYSQGDVMWNTSAGSTGVAAFWYCITGSTSGGTWKSAILS